MEQSKDRKRVNKRDICRERTCNELASGLSFPVGFKNGTDGSLDIAIDAIGAYVFCVPYLSCMHAYLPFKLRLILTK